MLKGYSPPANFRGEINQQGGGVAIFVKSGIDHKFLYIIYARAYYVCCITVDGQ